jgi:hypothetical protein
MKKSFVQNAALYGLLLGFVSIIFGLISSALQLSIIVSGVLTFIKFVTTVTVFWFILKKQANESETFTFGNAVAFGTLTSLFSSIILGLFAFLQLTIISPDAAEQMFEHVVQLYEQMGIDEEQIELLSNLMPYIPYFALFGTVITYTIVGLIYSLIMGSFVKKDANLFN